MHHLAIDEQFSIPIGAVFVRRDFYADLISGAKSAQEAMEVLQQTSGLLA